MSVKKQKYFEYISASVFQEKAVLFWPIFGSWFSLKCALDIVLREKPGMWLKMHASTSVLQSRQDLLCGIPHFLRAHIQQLVASFPFI